MTLSFLLAFFTIFGQTPKTEGLIVSSSKFNLLYSYVENPVLINESFDSLRFEDGLVKIHNSRIFVVPFETGRKKLFLFKGNQTLYYIFRVKEIDVRPQILFKRTSHTKNGRLQDKRLIMAHWEVDYDVKLKIKEFKIEIIKKNGAVLSFQNETNYFNSNVVRAFKNLKEGDYLKMYDIKCSFPHGTEIMAENREISL